MASAVQKAMSVLPVPLANVVVLGTPALLEEPGAIGIGEDYLHCAYSLLS